jgi:5-methylcytosine-specific restriction endonuclease McrA
MAKFLFTKGHPVSDEVRKKISESKLGKIRLDMRGKNNPNWVGGLPNCVECGKKLTNYDAKFCQSCGRKGLRSFQWKGGKPHCLNCGVQINYQSKWCWDCGKKLQVHHNFSVNKNNKPPMLGKHHSSETKMKIRTAQLGKPKKEIGYQYKQSLDRRERINFRNTMQKLIFERDSYTCQICGARGDLQVDHIQSWADYVELRFSMDNCRTLCAGCHYKITFGREMPENLKGWGHHLLERERILQ